MGKVLMPNVPWSKGHIRLDGSVAMEPGLVEADSIEIRLPSKARQRDSARAQYRLRPEGQYLCLYEKYNARTSPCVVEMHGLEVVFEYGDGHGKRWCLFAKILGQWCLDYDVPGHHGHGTVRKRICGTTSSFQSCDRERRLEEAPIV